MSSFSVKEKCERRTRWTALSAASWSRSKREGDGLKKLDECTTTK